MKLFFSLLLFFVSFAAVSQSKNDTTTILYNASWQVIQSGTPAFVGLVWKEGNKWHKQDYYYPESKLQMDGMFADKDLKVKDGVFTWYHKNGMMKDSCLYVNWQHEGSQMTWDDEGNQTSLRHWHKDLPVDTAIWWNSKGAVTAVQLTDSSGDGVYQQYLEDGKTARVKGLLLAGKRTGKWIFKDTQGILGLEATYLADSVISSLCYDEKGEPETGKKECVVEKPASFKGGTDGWRRYLERSLQYPVSAQENRIQGVVKIQFNIEKDGTVTDVKALDSPDESLAKEGVRILEHSPKWVPAVQYNRVVIYRHIQNITFALQ
jgi:TonB family protein